MCLEASHGAAQGERAGRGHPAIRRRPSPADHPKVSLALSWCLLCAGILTRQRVNLSLPISSPSLTLCRWQMMEMPGRSSSRLLAKPAVPPSGNLAFLLQEMCIDTKDCGKSFSPLFHGIHSCPKEVQRGEMNPDTDTAEQEQGNHTHTYTHTQGSWRNYHAQIAAKVLLCPLPTHPSFLPLAFLALAAPVGCLGPSHAFCSS